ncbi:MAG: GTPase ObgE, partial [Elusimicrobiota bacterium]
GGDGCASFRREKFVPFGGPDGGNGGKGGDIYLRSEPSISTLLDFTYKPHFSARDGLNGMGKNMAGAGGEDLIIKVPCGTVVQTVEKADAQERKRFLGDLNVPGKTILVAKGGRGGRGNTSFKTQKNTAPKISEKGEPGEKVTLELELKLIADVGLVGYPNAGKSTFISKVTSARPKIASYPFTTLRPNLGVCSYKGRNFAIADIPGLIEGASDGKGLGYDFLRHIERTRIIIHIVDITGYGGKTAYQNYMLIKKEMKEYSAKLLSKPALIVLNKIDLTGSKKYVSEFKKKFSTARKQKIFPVSCITGEGLNNLLDEVIELLSKTPSEECASEAAQEARQKYTRYYFEPEFKITRQGKYFIVSGKKVERLTAMTNFNQEESLRRFQNILKKMGVEKELVRKGVKEGDSVKIGDFEFEYQK